MKHRKSDPLVPLDCKKGGKKEKKKVPNFLKVFRTSSPGKSLKQNDELQFGKTGSRRVGKNFTIRF